MGKETTYPGLTLAEAGTFAKSHRELPDKVSDPGN